MQWVGSRKAASIMRKMYGHVLWFEVIQMGTSMEHGAKIMKQRAAFQRQVGKNRKEDKSGLSENAASPSMRRRTFKVLLKMSKSYLSYKKINIKLD